MQINEFSIRVSGYKINRQKSVVFLCTSNEHPKRNWIGKNPLTIANNGVKYLGINSIKEAHNLYAEDYETFLSKLKKT